MGLARLGEELPPAPAWEYFGVAIDSRPRLGDALIRGAGEGFTTSAKIEMVWYGVTVTSRVVMALSIALNSALHPPALEGFFPDRN